jgi:chemotaxis family two-component system sensor kinase Cph1
MAESHPILRADENASIPFVSADAPIDLTNCDREPIHIPGAIQPYGVLLAFDVERFTVLQASESTHAHLGVFARDLIGRTLAQSLGAGASEQVRRLLASGRDAAFGELVVAPGEGRQPTFDATLHRVGGIAVLELEPASPAARLRPDQISAAMRSTVRRLEVAESLAGVAQAVASEMRDVTGFDRVWVYRFHPDWHGEIIGESKRDGIETWLGMHYPASDIPAQARALFLRNWVRVIPDLAFVPSPLVPPDSPPLDLGGSLLRSVSPIHVQYLQNMGVTASLVISLIHRGTLWGLISGHHYSGPKHVPYAVRSLCEFLAQALSLQIGTSDRLERREYELHVRSTQSQLLAHLADDVPMEQSLATNGDLLVRSVGADGAALVRGGETTMIGATPSRDEITAIAGWFRGLTDDSLVTAQLSAVFPSAARMGREASGLLALPLSRDRRDLLMWFRTEQRQTVRWAGDPRKPVTLAHDGSRRLHPRGSFELWEEEARGTAAPWREIEVEAARDIRRALLDVFIRKAEEVARLNEELLAANAQLAETALELETQAEELFRQRAIREDLLARERGSRKEAEHANKAKADFLAVMSHELRTPLNAIGGYAQLLSLGVRGTVTGQQEQDLERIQVNQRHLLGLINSILNFTKLEAGQLQFRTTVVSLKKFLDGLDALVAPQMRAKSLAFAIGPVDAGLQVLVDEEKLRQILLNLLTNALKFSAEGGRVDISCRRDGAEARVIVRDTGRGIAAADLEAVFDPFVQVDRHVTPESEQGVGLGLAISRELARGMKGELTVASEPGVGSSFTVTLPVAS